VTSGGRVLAVTAVADDLEEAIKKAVDNIKLVHFQGMQFRRDIGHRCVNELTKNFVTSIRPILNNNFELTAH
jgi:phosphoribosylamine-glycine ligase